MAFSAMMRRFLISATGMENGEKNKPVPITQQIHAGRTGRHDYAQEKPDLDEHPDRAPLGMAGPPDPIRKLEAEMVFVTSRLPHSGHFTVSVVPDEVVRTSKCFLQSRQTYSYMGIVNS
jgi:hypothetical protein